MSDEEEGQPLAPRDALAVGEGFQDLHCPLALVRCGSQADGSELCIAAIVIREHEGKIVLAVPGSAWHRQVARRTLPKGFLTKVCGAEVAACGSALRSEALEGSTVRVWLGLVEPSNEGSIQIPDEMPEHVIGFGELSLGVPALPFVPALAAAAEEHFTFVTGESARGGEQDGLGARLARLELLVQSVVSQSSVPGPTAKAKAKTKPRGGAAVTSPLPELDPAVVSAAKAAGVSEHALAEMEALVKRGRGSRLKPEPGLSSAVAGNPLDESEADDDEAGGVGLEDSTTALPARAAPETKQAEAFAAAMFKLMEGYHKSSGKGGSALDKALEGAGSGSAEASALPTARRNSAARKALRDALVTSPDELSAESLMAEDLASAAPGVAVPGQVSARAWVEYRSKIGAYPSAMWATWIISGALDCLRTNRPAQARARLNLGLLIFDQMSIDKGSFVLAGEPALENPPQRIRTSNTITTAQGLCTAVCWTFGGQRSPSAI